MALQFDPSTGKITYRGEEVGEHIFKDGPLYRPTQHRI